MVWQRGLNVASAWRTSGVLRYPFSLIRESVRGKLLLLTLFPILLAMPLAVAVSSLWSSRFTYEQLFIKVTTDLSVARFTLDDFKQRQLATVRGLAGSHQLYQLIEARDRAGIQVAIAELKETGAFSYLDLAMPDGQRALADQQGAARPSRLWQEGLKGQAGVTIEIFSPEDLANERRALAAEAELILIDTPKAARTLRHKEDRGMMLRTIAPVFDEHGGVIALLDGGVLLNGNFGFVDGLRDLVYGKGSLVPGSIGTVTLFLDDVRISTNVPLRPDERALGTRVSDEVRQRVLVEGGVWVDRAFVVNDWYISAYEPILDGTGERVGILYVGFLERPYRAMLTRGRLALVGLFLGLMLLSAAVAIYGARSIFKPLERMSHAVQSARRGEGSRRIGAIQSDDEIGRLAREFDDMLDQLQERQQQLQQLNDRLESKVEERTLELQQKNTDLERTVQALREMRKQLVMAEKLAALGGLTAGVAHEINNPAQVILGNLDLLVMELGAGVEPVQEEVDIIVDQVYRIQAIIEHLLQYARPAEPSVDEVAELDVNGVVKRSRGLVSHLINGRNVVLELHLDAVSLVRIDASELEQVLVNLLSNAVQALPDTNGRITVTTHDWSDQGVVIRIADSGCGLSAEEQEQIFNPFWTKRHQGQGTGLGLSVSYGIMRRYGGNITVRSATGEGAEFSVWILARPQKVEDEKTILEQLQVMGGVRDSEVSGDVRR